MKPTVKLELTKNIQLFEKVLNGASSKKTAVAAGVRDDALRAAFRKIYKAIRTKEHMYLEVEKVIGEQDKFDLFTMKINRAYWLYQLKFLKQELGIKEEQNG